MMKKLYGENIDRELTWTGLCVCMIMGAAAEWIVFAATRIKLDYVPLSVLIFLWATFGFLSSGILFLGDLTGQKLCAWFMLRQQRKERIVLEREYRLIETVRAALDHTMTELLRKEKTLAEQAVVCQFSVSEDFEYSELGKKAS